MPQTMTNKAGDIFRQEIGALANADGEAHGAIFFNTLRDGSLLAAVSVHVFTKAGAPEQRPTYHSGWFAQADRRRRAKCAAISAGPARSPQGAISQAVFHPDHNPLRSP